jgi:hypothetical protein
MFKRSFDQFEMDLSELRAGKKVCVSVTDFTLDEVFYYFNTLFNDKDHPIDLTNEPKSIIAEPGSILEQECLDYFYSDFMERYNRIPEWVLREVDGDTDIEDYNELDQDIAREEASWNDLFDFDN